MIKYFLLPLLFTFNSSCVFNKEGHSVYSYNKHERELRIQEVDSVFKVYESIVDYKKIEPTVIESWGKKMINKVEMKTLNDYRLFQLFPIDSFNYEIYILFGNKDLLAIKEGSSLGETKFYEFRYFLDQINFSSTWSQRGMRETLKNTKINKAIKLKYIN